MITFLCSTTPNLEHIIKLTRLRIVDNSTLGKQAELAGKPARCLHVYNKNHIGTVGDKILVAVKGQKRKAIIIGVRQKQKPMMPRFDTNNIVLIDDNGMPLGTRIKVPVPSQLRGKTQSGDYSKILAIASKFV